MGDKNSDPNTGDENSCDEKAEPVQSPPDQNPAEFNEENEVDISNVKLEDKTDSKHYSTEKVTDEKVRTFQNGTPDIIIEENGVVNQAFSENAENEKHEQALRDDADSNKRVNGAPLAVITEEDLEPKEKSDVSNNGTVIEKESNPYLLGSRLRNKHANVKNSDSFDDDAPTYLAVRSRRGLEFGSEKLITDAVSQCICTST